MPAYSSQELLDNPIRKEELEILFEGDIRCRDKFFISLIWLSMSRINEIVRRLRKSACRFEKRFSPAENQDVEFLVLTMFTEKKRRGQATMRDVPIRLTPDKNPKRDQSVFAKAILDELGRLKDGDFLIPVSARRARQILERHTIRGQPICPHILIHSRTTHLMRYHGCDSQHLKRLRGWVDSRPADKYTHLALDDLMEKL